MMVGAAFLAVLGRELRLAIRHPADALAAVLFFLLVAALFPFGVGPAPETLARLAPGARGLWLVACQSRNWRKLPR